MSYTEVFPPSQKKPKYQIDQLSPWQMISFALHLHLDHATMLAIGATLQAVLIILPIPTRYTLAPAVLYLLSRGIRTALISKGFMANPYLKGSLAYRYTALVPDKHGNLPSGGKVATGERVAVLLLAARSNHPLGFAGAPQTKAFGELFERMRKDLRTWPQSETGFLGHTLASIPTSNGIHEVLNISYWRSAAHILKYAESPAHRDAMKWWTEAGGYEADGGKVRHMGIMHEIYESAPGKWESVYMGYQPTLLGATTFEKQVDKQEDGSVPEEWISSVIEARKGKVASSRGRMGMDWHAELNENV